jgi:hypothetical protein
MKKFVKITTRSEDGAIVRSWIDAEKIIQLSQDSGTQAGNNEGTCIFNDGIVIPIITFNETLDSLN